MVRLKRFEEGQILMPHPDTKQTNYHFVPGVKKAKVYELHHGGSCATLTILEGAAQQREGYSQWKHVGERMVMYQANKWVLFEDVEEYEIY